MNSRNLIDSSIEKIEWILVILSSILLGIWAVKDTIALRNILLFTGTIFSTYYIVKEWRHGNLKDCCNVWNALPFLLLALTFVWVISHYLFFSIDPLKQFAELKSTWLRAFMASIIGIGTGLALKNHPSRLSLLWLGLLIAFLVLFYQYIPRALEQNRFLVPDYDHYLFHLKINTVLAGMILIVGVDGALLDLLRANNYRLSNLSYWYLLYWLLKTCLALWAFVYIVDSRNGMGLAVIIYFFWFICAINFFIKEYQVGHLNLRTFQFFLIAFIGLCLIFYFFFLQMAVNKGWHSLLEDTMIAVQIDHYPNWQNPAEMGYPKRSDGQEVKGSTYERVAWATAGSRVIISYPQGVGLLAFPYAKNPNRLSDTLVTGNSQGIATHSGWVELGLAFGIPMLALIFSILMINFIRAIRNAYPTRMTVLGFVTLITCLYTVGELTVQHGLEILFYLFALITSLNFTKSSKT